MMRLLVSVRDEVEACAAAAAGAGLVDLKDPAAGALGGLAPPRIAALVQVLRARHPGRFVSATIGDLEAGRGAEILARVAAVAHCGVDVVKVGVARPARGDGAAEDLLEALAACGAPVVPVFLVDAVDGAAGTNAADGAGRAGVDEALLARALRAPAFPAVMVDTAAKGAGSLVQRVPRAALAAFVARVRASGRKAGLAGALRLEDIPALRALGPDFAGFRSAACAGGRAGPLDAARVQALAHALLDCGVGSEA
jgi:uncharacterized protein (UPF0264 family)